MKKFLRNSTLFILLLSLFGCNSAAKQTMPIESSEDINLESHIQVPQEDISNEIVIPVVEEVSPAGESGSRIRSKDGMEMVYVPEGTFMMGRNASYSDEHPARDVYLDAYWIDKYEVTNEQYAKCIAAGKCTNPHESAAYYAQNNYYENSSGVDYPVIFVDWYQAKSYCEWVGGDLPTEAQWEKAARGTDGRKYPWGNQEPDSSYANYDNRSMGDTSKIGSFEKGASPYGAMDMAGNVWEWVNDWWADKYDETDTINPQGPTNGEQKVMRGGSWWNNSAFIRTQYRNEARPNDADDFSGFRCISLP